MAKKIRDNTSESLDDFLRRAYGDGIMETADKALAPRPRSVLKTPLSLAVALNGGIPDGTVCLITGKAKIGKTTLCLELVKNAQEEGRLTYYINIERRCTPSLLSTIRGLDQSKLHVIPHRTDQPLTAEDYLNIIERIIKTQKRALIIVDSLAMLSTMAEQEELIGSKKDMAGSAKLMSSFFRRMQQIVDTNDTIVVFISQLMTNREPRGKKWLEKGGVAVQYACSVWLTASWAKMWEKNPEKDAPDGHDIHITVQSSAMGRPHLPCSLPLRYGVGIDKYRDIVVNAENLGLIEKAGAWYSIPMFKDDKGNPVKFQGLARLTTYLIDNHDKADLLEKEIRDILLPEEVKNEVNSE